MEADGKIMSDMNWENWANPVGYSQMEPPSMAALELAGIVSNIQKVLGVVAYVVE
jgi:hypothetical protein